LAKYHNKKNISIMALLALSVVIVFLWVSPPTSKTTGNNMVNMKPWNESKTQQIDTIELAVIDPSVLKNQSNDKYTITKIVQKDGLFYSKNQIAQGGPGGTLNIFQIEITQIASNIDDPLLLTYLSNALHANINAPQQLKVNKSYKLEPGKSGSIKAHTIYKKYKISVEKNLLLNFKRTNNYEILIATEIVFHCS